MSAVCLIRAPTVVQLAFHKWYIHPAAVLALVTPFDYLLDMASISTLFGFLVVALALLWRRLHGFKGAKAESGSLWPPALHLLWLFSSHWVRKQMVPKMVSRMTSTGCPVSLINMRRVAAPSRRRCACCSSSAARYARPGQTQGRDALYRTLFSAALQLEPNLLLLAA